MKAVTYGLFLFLGSFSVTLLFLYFVPLMKIAPSLYASISHTVGQSASVAQASEDTPVDAPQVAIQNVPKIEVIEAPEPDVADSLWEVATGTAEWQARDSAASFVFNDKMWIMGGLNGNGVTTNKDHGVHYWEARHFNDIWSSEDGVVWKNEKKHAAWPERRSMSVVYFKGTLWMIGGWGPQTGYTNDIWQSTDGIEWKQVLAHAPWSIREGQTVEIFQNKMWLFGGVNYDERVVHNDVWYSEDGLTWHKATSSAPWSPRWDHATTIFKDTIFLTGGMDLTKESFHDVWSSKDGVTWTLVTNAPTWQSRQGHGLVHFKEKLWIVGRLNDDEGAGVNDVWYSDDGVVWKKTNTDPEWLGREDHGVLVFKDYIYVLGGMDKNWQWRNDVVRLK